MTNRQAWPARSPAARAAKAAASARARHLLDCLLPFEETKPARGEVAVGGWWHGDARSLYEEIKRQIEQEAMEPTPTSILLRPDGNAEASW